LMIQILHVADIRCLPAAWDGTDPCCLMLSDFIDVKFVLLLSTCLWFMV
jgi:hypothetical protein